MKKHVVLAGLGVLLMSMQPLAHAQGVACDPGPQSKGYTDFIDSLINKDDTWAESVQLVRQSQKLGDAAERAFNDCAGADAGSPSCKGGLKQALRNLYLETQDYAVGTPMAKNPDGLSLSRDTPPASAAAQTVWTIELLNGDPPWFRACPVPKQGAPAPTGRKDGKSGFEAFLENVIIGKSKDDASRAFAKREFATLAYTDNRDADSKTTEIDLFLGWKGPTLAKSNVIYSFVPFLSLQKKSIEQPTPSDKEVDDLTFGLSAPVTIAGANVWAQHVIAPAIEWETDTEFDSSMTIASVAWTPVGLGSNCWGRYFSSDLHLKCDYAFVADYADVGDPGEKTSLTDVDQYTRVGFNLGFDYFHDLPGDGQLNLGVSFKGRKAVDGDDGDAELFTTVLQYLPGDASHFSFGIEYNHGEDLSSLDAKETTLLRFGYRQ